MREPPPVMARSGATPGAGRPRVVVVGGGFSGTAAVVHLLEAGVPVDVTIVEQGPRTARGVAYGTDAPEHLLNVPACRMSAHADRPDDFLEWLRAGGDAVSPEAYVPRARYGDYLEETLARAARLASAHGASLALVRGRAVDATRGEGGVVVCVEGRDPLVADRVVLAVGHRPSRDPLAGLGRALDAARYARDVRAAAALEGIPRRATVMILGTGLTAIDVILTLRRHGHEGDVLALSRRGLRPQTQPETTCPPARLEGTGIEPGVPLRALVRAVRRLAREEAAAGRDWRGVVGALRPLTQRLWAGLSPVEKARFLRHLRPHWDTHRHRMAPAVADSILTLEAIGRLRVRAGRVVRATPTARGVRVTWRERRHGVRRTTQVARIVDATGVSSDVRAGGDPLLDALLARGAIRPDPLGLGIETDALGRVLDAKGRPADDLFTLGPLRQGALWETTAVPEIRAQARDLAGLLLASPPR